MMMQGGRPMMMEGGRGMMMVGGRPVSPRFYEGGSMMMEGGRPMMMEGGCSMNPRFYTGNPWDAQCFDGEVYICGVCYVDDMMSPWCKECNFEGRPMQITSR